MQRSNIVYFSIAFSSFILFLLDIPVTLLLIITFILSICIIKIGRISHEMSGALNIALLLYLPMLLQRKNYVFFIRSQSRQLFIILLLVFIMTIVNFLSLAASIHNNKGFHHFFSKLIIIFVIYMALIYCVLNCFAILYTYLGNLFNEGIVNEKVTLSKIDALYFSTTTFFTIGLGDIYPTEYAQITKTLVIVEAIISHIITVILWPVAIILLFDNLKIPFKHKENV